MTSTTFPHTGPDRRPAALAHGARVDCQLAGIVGHAACCCEGVVAGGMEMVTAVSGQWARTAWALGVSEQDRQFCMSMAENGNVDGGGWAGAALGPTDGWRALRRPPEPLPSWRDDR